MNHIALGTTSGAIGTLAMTVSMVSLPRIFSLHQPKSLPPTQVTKGVVEKVHAWQPLPQISKFLMTTTLHFTYGSAQGVAYVFLAKKRLKNMAMALPLGVAYGACLWLAGYFVVTPRLRLTPPEHQQPEGHIVRNFVSHLVWGGVTAAAANLLSRNSGSSSSRRWPV